MIHMVLCFFFIFVFHFESAMKSPKEAEKLNANARSGLKDKFMPETTKKVAFCKILKRRALNFVRSGLFIFIEFYAQ